VFKSKLSNLSKQPMATRAIRLLKDRKWHDVDEIAERLEIDIGKFKQVLGFLAKYGLVLLSDDGRRARLDPDFVRIILAK